MEYSFGLNTQLCKPIDYAIRMPRVDNIKTEVLSSEQLEKLLDVIDNDLNIQVANFMKMVIFTGIKQVIQL